jgi:hypothetical protein
VFKPILLGVALASAALCAQATVSAATGQLPGSFIDLSSAGTVTGGMVYDQSEDYSGTVAARPLGTVGHWLASGPNNGDGSSALLHLGAGVTAVSFLWGSPDFYNSFAVTVVGGSSGTFGSWADKSSTWLGITLDGNQSVANYITFSTDSGYISSISFNSPGTNAIEIANVAVVPEPEAYGLALAGLSVVGFAMARRRKV